MPNIKTALVISPAPIEPTSAGNRQRVLAVCKLLQRIKYEVHLAITDHEDQIYRTFNAQPPNDLNKTLLHVDRVFYVETKSMAPIKTTAKNFDIDDWYPEELDNFLEVYTKKFGDPDVLLVNYVFYSKILEKKSDYTLGVIDTHDRFSDRKKIYDDMRQEPNFFYTVSSEEAKGLARCDIGIAIQEAEKEFLAQISDTKILTLNHLPIEKTANIPNSLRNFVFLGHGNDVNFVSISKFMHLWASIFPEDGVGPNLIIAGEVGRSLGQTNLPNVKIVGYVPNLDDIYASADAIVAPLIFGTGLKIKVVEALARGKIVIGTKTSFEGVNTKHQSHKFSNQIDMISYIKNIHAENCSDLVKMNNSVWEEYKANVKKQENILEREINQSSSNTRNIIFDAVAPKNVCSPSNTSIKWLSNGYVIWIEDCVLEYINDKSIRRVIQERLVSATLLATQRIPFSSYFQKNEDCFEKISRSRLFIGKVSGEVDATAVQSGDLDLLKHETNGKIFFPDFYLKDFSEVSYNIQEILAVLHHIGRNSATWNTGAQIVRYELKSMTVSALIPSTWARNPTLEQSDCIMRYVDGTYEYIINSSVHYISDPTDSRELAKLLINKTISTQQRPLKSMIPVDLTFRRHKNSDFNIKSPESLLIRKGSKFCFVSLV